MRISRGRRAAFAVLALSLLPAGAHAWGDEGHAIIALIAQHELSAGSTRQVQQLLATDRSDLVADPSMASEAVWADRYRDSDRDGTRLRYEQTQRWHYVDLEWHHPDEARACAATALPDSVPASAGPARDCVIDKVEQFERELAASSSSPQERLLALQFLLHLVGDLHQPLHAIDDHDEGGIRRRVVLRDASVQSLHHYWDVEFVQALGRDAPSVARDLLARISSEDRRAWQAGSALQWAWQSHDLGAQVAYESLPGPCRAQPCELSAAYASRAEQTVALQLQRAGVRLGWLINRALP